MLKDEAKAYLDKLKHGEHCFILRAQDVSAPLAVTAWVMIQQEMRLELLGGETLDNAVKNVRTDKEINVDCENLTDKDLCALGTALAMGQFEPRKVAD